MTPPYPTAHTKVLEMFRHKNEFEESRGRAEEEQDTGVLQD
jgi:hypothetical protein